MIHYDILSYLDIIDLLMVSGFTMAFGILAMNSNLRLAKYLMYVGGIFGVIICIIALFLGGSCP